MELLERYLGRSAVLHTVERAVKEAVMTEDSAAIAWSVLQLGTSLSINPADIDRQGGNYQNA